MKHPVILLLFSGNAVMAIGPMKPEQQIIGVPVQTFSKEPEFPHQLHNAFKADALTDGMVDYFLKNSSEKLRARRLEQIADMAPEILAAAERLMNSNATKVQIHNALAGLKLIDFLQGVREHVNTVARAERVAKSLQVKTTAVDL